LATKHYYHYCQLPFGSSPGKGFAQQSHTWMLESRLLQGSLLSLVLLDMKFVPSLLNVAKLEAANAPNVSLSTEFVVNARATRSVFYSIEGIDVYYSNVQSYD
jgi:hypothetical protein